MRKMEDGLLAEAAAIMGWFSRGIGVSVSLD